MNLTDIRVRLLNGTLSLIRLSDGILYKYFFSQMRLGAYFIKKKSKLDRTRA
jgi:hypothetical protein